MGHGKTLTIVEGELLSLDDIEHRILRPIWSDPRIYYVLNCASYGCSNLNDRALTGRTVDKRLDTAAKVYINSDRAVLFKNGDLYVSSIYRWFVSDFGGTDASIIAHLRIFAEPVLSIKLADVSSIKGVFYDWALNEMVGTGQNSSSQTSSSQQP